MTDPTTHRIAGAVDLGALRTPPPARAATTDASGRVVVDVTEATFQTEVVDRSRQVPVVLDFWAAWCGPCRQLSPILERLATESGGAWVLAKIDVDANQRLSGAAGVQGIPAVKAVVDGQIVSEFTGAQPEAVVRQWLDQVLTFAANRLSGAEAAAEPAGPSPLDEAYDALAAGDLDRAESGLTEALARDPGDAAAQAGLAQVTLIRRAQSYDPADLESRLRANPDDVEANGAMADIDVLSGRLDEAFRRLLDLVRRTSGEERDAVKAHLLGLFEALDPGDPLVLRTRRELANALF